MLPYLVVLRYPLVISIILSVGAGYLSSMDDTLSLSRAVAMLPFFRARLEDQAVEPG